MHICGLRGPPCQTARDWAYDAGAWDPALHPWSDFIIGLGNNVSSYALFIAAIDQLYRWARGADFSFNVRSFRWAWTYVARLP